MLAVYFEVLVRTSCTVFLCWYPHCALSFKISNGNRNLASHSNYEIRALDYRGPNELCHSNDHGLMSDFPQEALK